jgi:hypothetical protein
VLYEFRNICPPPNTKKSYFNGLFAAKMLRFCVWLVLSSFPATLFAQEFTSSNLPIIIIDTDGQPIQDDPKIVAHMGIIYNGTSTRSELDGTRNVYDGEIGIELRGNSSQTFNKKAYGFETRTNDGAEAVVSLLGLPPESDWILAAAYIDKTLMRDPLAYELSRRMGNWASRTVHCELVLNGSYQGVYILEEKIKRDKHRVDIDKLEEDENSGTDVTGGYIFEVAQSGDGFDSRRRYVYPKGSEITPQQTSYIRSYDDAFRAVVNGPNYDDPVDGYAAWIDVQSFIDEILIQELCKNSDAYGWSSYFHKEKNEKLKAGPAWDFDQGFSNSTFNNGPNHSEWIIEKSLNDSWLRENYPPFWIKLFREKTFYRQLRLRWTALRETVWTTESIMSYIDSTASHLEEAQQRNFKRWDILGREVWRSTPGAEQRKYYFLEVEYLKTFLQNRILWMDSKLKLVVTDVGEVIDEQDVFFNTPNPFTNETIFHIKLTKPGPVSIDIYDTFGRHVQSLANVAIHEDELPLNAEILLPGIYLCILRTKDGKTRTTKMVLQR